MAGEFYISEKTVEFHLDNIYSKIGTRTQLMVGWLTFQNGMDGKNPGNP